MRQPDLFDTQTELFADRPEATYAADPEKVRLKLLAVLEQAKAADTMPWTRDKLRYHQTVFPQMSRWLAPEEAAQLCLEFETELKRLQAA